MRTLILILICTLINGCGLFKNTSKDVLVSKSGVSIEQRKETNLNVTDNSTSLDVNTSVKSEVNFNGYKVTADRIVMRSDGSIQAEGNVSMSGANRGEKNSKDSSRREEKTDLSLQQKTDESVKAKQTESTKQVAKKSEPSGKGIIYGAVAVLIVVFGIMVYFGIYPRKGNNAQR